jgi:hypothetical protein
MKLILIGQTIIPLLVSISTKIKKALAELLYPVISIGYMHTYIKNKWKREMIDQSGAFIAEPQYPDKERYFTLCKNKEL